MMSDWLDAHKKLINQYRPCDVYNADETGIFYQLLPEETFALKGKNCTSGKRSKVRLTALITANIIGLLKSKNI